MKRLIPLIGVLFALLISAGMFATSAQQLPPPTLPPIASPTFDPTFAVVPTATIDPALLPTPDAAQPTSSAPVLSNADTEALPLLLRARNDLELIADQALGAPQRPNGWNGSVDVTNPQLGLLVRYDLELLAGTLLGPDARPEGWFGGVVSVPLAFARDIRHDLEILTDGIVGTSTIRPAGWQGDDPLMRCDRVTQALIVMLDQDGYGINADFSEVGYCERISVQISQFVEREVLQPPPAPITIDEIDTFNANQPFRVESPFTVSFLDRAAIRRAGVIPEGTGFTALSRSGFGFSNMMLVEGNGFRVFVDYLTTPLTTDQFNSLPEMPSGVQLTTCNAIWCE